MAESDSTLLYGSLGAGSIAVLLLFVAGVVVMRLVRKSKDTKTWKPHGSRLKHMKPFWYTPDRIRCVPGQMPTRGGVLFSGKSDKGHDSNDSPKSATLPTYRSAYRQTAAPMPNIRQLDASLIRRLESPISRYKSRDISGSNISKTKGGSQDCSPKQDGDRAPENKTLSRWRSEENLPQLRNVLQSGHYGSCLSIDSTSLESDRETDSSPFKLHPSVVLSMVWASSSYSLSITISKLANLPPKLKESHIVVTIKLLNTALNTSEPLPSTSPPSPGPKTLMGIPYPHSLPRAPAAPSPPTGAPRTSQSSWSLSDSTSPSRPQYKVKKSLDANFSQVFTFHDIALVDVKRSELSLELKTKRRGILSMKPFGSLTFDLGESGLEQDKPIVVQLGIATARQNSLTFLHGKHIPSCISPERSVLPLCPGSLQVQLMYQTTGHWTGRVKMVVLRGRSLISPRKGGEYRVDIVVRLEGATIALHKTCAVATVAAPVWNFPLLFDVHQAKVSEVTVEVTLVRIGRTRTTSRLGNVFLGLDTTDTGTKHWQEVLAREQKEITMWHALLQ